MFGVCEKVMVRAALASGLFVALFGGTAAALPVPWSHVGSSAFGDGLATLPSQMGVTHNASAWYFPAGAVLGRTLALALSLSFYSSLCFSLSNSYPHGSRPSLPSPLLSSPLSSYIPRPPTTPPPQETVPSPWACKVHPLSTGTETSTSSLTTPICVREGHRRHYFPPHAASCLTLPTLLALPPRLYLSLTLPTTTNPTHPPAASTDALNATGYYQWAVDLSTHGGAFFGFYMSSPTVSSDGTTVYIGGEDGYLTAVDTTTGRKKWEYSTGGLAIDGGITTAVVGGVKNVFFGSYNTTTYAGTLHAVVDRGTSGTRKWIFPDPATFGALTLGAAYGTPVVDVSGSYVYYLFLSSVYDTAVPALGRVYELAIAKPVAASKYFSLPEEGLPVVSPSPAYDKTHRRLYVTGSNPAAHTSYVYALSTPFNYNPATTTTTATTTTAAATIPGAGALTPLWTYTHPAQSILASPTVASDGSVYVVTTAGTVVALDPLGNARWMFDTLGTALTQMVLPYDNSELYVHAGYSDGATYLYALTAGTGDYLWGAQTAVYGNQTSSPALAADGSILVGSTDGYLWSYDGPHTTWAPTANPTRAPTATPTHVPTKFPTKIPTTIPTKVPTPIPTALPSFKPTVAPSAPTIKPVSSTPSAAPVTATGVQTGKPSGPTLKPTVAPSGPTIKPVSSTPSSTPVNAAPVQTSKPTGPTAKPVTPGPTLKPTVAPSKPTFKPTVAPSAPTFKPSSARPTVAGSGRRLERETSLRGTDATSAEGDEEIDDDMGV